MLGVGIVSRFALYRGLLRSYISALQGMKVVLEASEVLGSVEAFRQARPSVLLFDSFDAAEDLSNLRVIHKLLPSMKIVFLTQQDDAMISVKAIEAGAQGCLSRESGPDVLTKALNQVSRGELWIRREVAGLIAGKWVEAGFPEKNESDDLTLREWAILALLARGMVNKEIASELAISINTVKAHLAAIYRKTKVSTRLESVLWYHQNVQRREPAPESSETRETAAPVEITKPSLALAAIPTPAPQTKWSSRPLK